LRFYAIVVFCIVFSDIREIFWENFFYHTYRSAGQKKASRHNLQETGSMKIFRIRHVSPFSAPLPGYCNRQNGKNHQINLISPSKNPLFHSCTFPTGCATIILNNSAA